VCHRCNLHVQLDSTVKLNVLFISTLSRYLGRYFLSPPHGPATTAAFEYRDSSIMTQDFHSDDRKCLDNSTENQ